MVKTVGAYCIRPYKISYITLDFHVGRMQYAPTLIFIVSTPIRNLFRYLCTKGEAKIIILSQSLSRNHLTSVLWRTTKKLAHHTIDSEYIDRDLSLPFDRHPVHLTKRSAELTECYVHPKFKNSNLYKRYSKLTEYSSKLAEYLASFAKPF